MQKKLFTIALLVAAAGLAGAGAKAGLNLKEPPMELLLDLEGKQVPVALDKPFTVKVNGADVTMKITAMPERTLNLGEATIKYPREYTYAVDDSTEGVLQWTLSGNDNVVIVSRFTEGAPAELLKTMEGELRTAYGRDKTKVVNSEVSIGGKKYASRKVTANISGQKLVQELVGLSAGKASFILIIQDTPDDNGGTSKDTQRMLNLLDKHWKSN